MAVLDITGFNQSVWERCERLNRLDIPLLLISPRLSASVRELGISHGARSMMEKPLLMRERAETIHGFMRSDS